MAKVFDLHWFRVRLAVRRAARRGLVPELDDRGQVVAWVNPEVLERLRSFCR